VNWDGVRVNPKEETWGKKEAFSIGDTVITREAVTAVSATTVILIIVGVGLFLFITYRKRE